MKISSIPSQDVDHLKFKIDFPESCPEQIFKKYHQYLHAKIPMPQKITGYNIIVEKRDFSLIVTAHGKNLAKILPSEDIQDLCKRVNYRISRFKRGVDVYPPICNLFRNDSPLTSKKALELGPCSCETPEFPSKPASGKKK